MIASGLVATTIAVGINLQRSVPPCIISVATTKSKLSAYNKLTNKATFNDSNPYSLLTHRTTLMNTINSMQSRYAHTDINVPDFDFYRRDSLKDPSKPSEVTDGDRKLFTYAVLSVASAPLVYGAQSVFEKTIDFLQLPGDVVAAGKIEVKIGDIPIGKNLVVKWRGKPIFIRRRTDEEITREQGYAVSELRHQQHDNERVQKSEWLVVIGICTHLGCVPIANAGDYGGYYCPCHGSHYDCSGRIRKGPAPLNLEVPEYYFKTDDTIVIG